MANGRKLLGETVGSAGNRESATLAKKIREANGDKVLGAADFAELRIGRAERHFAKFTADSVETIAILAPRIGGTKNGEAFIARLASLEASIRATKEAASVAFSKVPKK